MGIASRERPRNRNLVFGMNVTKHVSEDDLEALKRKKLLQPPKSEASEDWNDMDNDIVLSELDSDAAPPSPMKASTVSFGGRPFASTDSRCRDAESRGTANTEEAVDMFRTRSTGGQRGQSSDPKDDGMLGYLT